MATIPIGDTFILLYVLCYESVAERAAFSLILFCNYNPSYKMPRVPEADSGPLAFVFQFPGCVIREGSLN